MKRWTICLTAFFCLIFAVSGWGAEEKGKREKEDWTSSALSSEIPDFGLEKIQQFLDQQQIESQFSFFSLMEDLAEGNVKEVAWQIFSAFWDGIVTEMSESVSFLIQAVLLGILGAIFAQAAAVFPASRISETGFFITYLLIFTCLTAGFFTSVDTAVRVVENVLDFMKVLLPSFFLAVAFAGGSISSAAFYSGIVAMVSIAEFLCAKLCIPFVKVYVLLILAGNLSREDMIGRMIKGVEEGISWSVKTMAGLFLGLQLVQTMILPYADSVKQNGMKKLVSAIPGIGSGAEALLQVTMGTGVLIKNTIGGAAVVVLAILAAAPVAKLFFFFVLYKGAAAFMEPVCDRRISACVEGMAKAHSLLLRIVLAVVLLFAVSVGIVCSATNVVYFSG